MQNSLDNVFQKRQHIPKRVKDLICVESQECVRTEYKLGIFVVAVRQRPGSFVKCPSVDKYYDGEQN